MPKYLLVLLILLCQCLPLRASQGLRPAAMLDKTREQLDSMLARAATDTGKLVVLHNLVVMYEDKASILKLLALNKKPGLLDNGPYLLMLSMVNSPTMPEARQLALYEQMIDAFDRDRIQAPRLLSILRILFNDLNLQEQRRQYYSARLAKYQRLGLNQDAAVCYHALGGYYSLKGDYNSAINYYLRAADAFRPFWPSMYNDEMIVVGDCYSEWGNDAKAIYYLKLGMQLNRLSAPDFKSGRSAAIKSLALLEYGRGNYVASLGYLHQIILFSQNAPQDSAFRPMALVGSALNRIALRQLPLARKLLDTAEISGRSIRTPLNSISGYFEIDYANFMYYRAARQPDRAIAYLHTAYYKADTARSVQLRMKYLKALAAFCGDSGNKAGAYTYLDSYTRLADSVDQNTRSFRVASYEGEQKDIALAALQLHDAVQATKIGQRNTIIWISLAGLLVVCALLVFSYRQLQHNKKILSALRATQSQLIQAEKMASLGELTAGIAHEIQNPLNFVNNFSEINREMLDELEEELNKGDVREAMAIAADIKQNEEKINHHGKRADAIVKGMLEHSRSGSGQRELTDLNALANEYMGLAYHGLRARDKGFSAEMVTSLDPNLPLIGVIPQDMGRVFLNLFNNAFYAVNQRAKTAGADYKPEVSLSTRMENAHIIISVRDNGTGIPEAIREKIMQPFFTTKPTGEGTGLGLSLTYDMVVKGHGGAMEINSKEGEGAEFIVTLPLV